jgi:hypothetical protein
MKIERFFKLLTALFYLFFVFSMTFFASASLALQRKKILNQTAMYKKNIEENGKSAPGDSHRVQYTVFKFFTLMRR